VTAKGFFTDTTVCIGCKACEVACKQWNQLPDDGFAFTGESYDNTSDLGASTWRHVAFVEQQVPPEPGTGARYAGLDWVLGEHGGGGASGGVAPAGGDVRWLMLSDVCKHCTHAGCLDVCPTGAIVRTEFDSVFVQPDVCNGCGMCVPACPFGVIDRDEATGTAAKCTLCYDRLKDGMEPACAKACPTDSIVFGDVDDLRQQARDRVDVLHGRGVTDAYLYGADDDDLVGTGGLNAFFLLTDTPETYNLPPDPVDPTRTVGDAWRSAGVAAAGMVLSAAVAVWSARRQP
jgi:formate dehydrogenase iron-sulfur subunit